MSTWSVKCDAHVPFLLYLVSETLASVSRNGFPSSSDAYKMAYHRSPSGVVFRSIQLYCMPKNERVRVFFAHPAALTSVSFHHVESM